METPYITIEFNNGSVYAIPVSAIAEDRADFYTKKNPNTTYQKEYDFVMRDDFEAIDWFQNNMNWCDIKHKVECLVPPVPFDPELAWNDNQVEDIYI